MADSWRVPLRRNRKLADMTKHVPPVWEWNQSEMDRLVYEQMIAEEKAKETLFEGEANSKRKRK
jgi:hypothetical protein